MDIKKFFSVLTCLAIPVMINSIYPVDAKAENRVYGKAYLIGETDSFDNWEVSDDAIKIDGDAKYEYTWNVPFGKEAEIKYLALNIVPAKNISGFNIITFPELDVKIDEVWIDDIMLEDYNMNKNAVDMNYFQDGKGITRIYIKDGDTTTDINDLPSDLKVNKNIRVVFTVSGFNESGTSNYIPIESTVQATVTSTPVTNKITNRITTKTTTISKSLSSSTSSAPVSIDMSAPTGDNDIKFTLSVMAMSGIALFISNSKLKSGKKK